MRHDEGLTMGSFRLKLVGYFLLLALLPLVAFFWGFLGVASRSEVRLADARLQPGLRAAIAAYRAELDTAHATAALLARNRDFRVSLERRNRAVIRLALQDDPDLRVSTPDGFVVGSVPTLEVQRVVSVVGPRGLIGEVTASVRLDSALAARLLLRSGLEQGDQVLILDGNDVVGGPLNLLGTVPSRVAPMASVKFGGTRYRALFSSALPEQPRVRIIVATPQWKIDAANRSFQRRYLLGLLVSIALLGALAMLQGRKILRAVGRLVEATNAIAHGSLDERVPVKGQDELAVLGRSFNAMAEQLQGRLEELEAERARLREAFSRLGVALAATHDASQLMRVVVETVVEATGADGAILLGRTGEVIEAGDPTAGEDTFELALAASGTQSFGTLVLYGSSFDDESKETARSLATQAAVALENARLHGVVEQQALVDGLSGLANRRRCEDELEAELVRAERLGGATSLVFGDLDDFKAVNDVHGHPAGDAVLCAFAELLRESVREKIDTAGRFGGEEFVLLLPGTDAAGAAQVAERVRAALAERVIVTPGGAAIRITASFGVATAPPLANAAELISAADRALYDAKRAGKNRVGSAQLPLTHP
jgi:diguanylate cyclase (GGDEF)-like protein